MIPSSLSPNAWDQFLPGKGFPKKVIIVRSHSAAVSQTTTSAVLVLPQTGRGCCLPACLVEKCHYQIITARRTARLSRGRRLIPNPTPIGSKSDACLRPFARQGTSSSIYIGTSCVFLRLIFAACIYYSSCCDRLIATRVASPGDLWKPRHDYNPQTQFSGIPNFG